MATQEFVRSLRADGMSEEEIRQELRGAGYKTGRINKLLEATRARGSADPPPADEAGSTAAVAKHVHKRRAFHPCQEESSVSMDDAASGSLALVEDKAGSVARILSMSFLAYAIHAGKVEELGKFANL